MADLATSMLIQSLGGKLYSSGPGSPKIEAATFRGNASDGHAFKTTAVAGLLIEVCELALKGAAPKDLQTQIVDINVSLVGTPSNQVTAQVDEELLRGVTWKAGQKAGLRAYLFESDGALLTAVGDMVVKVSVRG